MSGVRLGFVAGLGVAVCLVLVGCGSADLEATPSESIESPRPSENSASASPPDPSPQPFGGAVDLDALANDGWDEMSRLDKINACNQYFTSNLPDQARLTVTSSAQEIAQVFADRFDLLSDLALDRSDPRFEIAAVNVAECMTSDITVDGRNVARENLQSSVRSMGDGSLGDFRLNTMAPEDILRHSDGLFAARSNDNLYYDAFAIEGYERDSLGDSIITRYYAWSPTEYQFTLMLVSLIDDVDSLSYFGTKPPIIVDPRRDWAPVADW